MLPISPTTRPSLVMSLLLVWIWSTMDRLVPGHSYQLNSCQAGNELNLLAAGGESKVLYTKVLVELPGLTVAGGTTLVC
jgi:hypothetical protein